MKTAAETTAVCCPPFDPTRWDCKTHEWNKKKFISDSIPEIFHMPLPGTFGKAVHRLSEQAARADAEEPADDTLLLCYDPSPWKSILLLSVSREVPHAVNVSLTGTFISKVFDGPYQDAPKHIREMDAYLGTLGKKAKQYYFHYTYCPECAKKYGHNYIVIFAETEA